MNSVKASVEGKVKCMHPRVVKVLTRLSSPVSPCLRVRDELQPSTGMILRKVSTTLLGNSV